MTPENTGISAQTSNIERNNIEAKPLRRCVSLGDAQCLDADEDVKFNEITQPKRNRKRPRPVSKNESLSSFFPSRISTDIPGEDDAAHTQSICNETNFRGASSFSHKIMKEPYRGPDISCLTSPERSVVSCDVDVIDDASQMSEDVCHKDLTRPSSPTTVDPSRPSSPRVDVHNFLNLHLQATQAESLLLPCKSLLSRLMAHPTYNRKGTFNKPVDHVGLGLNDYMAIVKSPMDLGTIKGLLQANSYLNHHDVARDVRLVFNNSQIYNPPSHPIHDAAKNLLHLFEEGYLAIYGEGKTNEVPSPTGSSKRNTHLDSMPPLFRVKSALPRTKHTCQACLGHCCAICKIGCTSLEPTLLICTGIGCAGLKIRRGSIYYCSVDGARAWCKRCHSCLPAVLPPDDGDEPAEQVSYKRDLLKRRNDEDVVERWIACVCCKRRVHEVCAFSNEFAVDKNAYNCPLCKKSENPFPDFTVKSVGSFPPSRPLVDSFVSGNSTPQKIEDVAEGTAFDARSLPSCPISIFIQKKVQERMLQLNCPTNAEKTLTVRIISNCEKSFRVPDVVRKHFRSSSNVIKEDNPTVHGTQEYAIPSAMVHYKSKAIALFQRIDGMDVCIFCMYVHEYDNKDKGNDSDQSKRVYIAYLDSVEHLQPRRLRTKIYHEILVSYLATARVRGYEFAHIWSCPPSRGNSFVFWSHPPTQRTPNGEHLLSWYHNALSHAVGQGIVTEIQSLFDFSFLKYNKVMNHGKDQTDESNIYSRTLDVEDECMMVTPPLLEGDFWMEEAMRVHSASLMRFMKSKKQSSFHSGNDESHLLDEALERISSSCPAVHVATLLHDCIMTHSSSLAFCRPVNAAALKLHDYHDVIANPMDLGTIHSRCLLGEYDTLHELQMDIKLVFKNAMTYNPEGHVVYKWAEEMWDFTQNQLSALARYWKAAGVRPYKESNNEVVSYEDYGKISMRLGTRIIAKRKDVTVEINKKKQPTALCKDIKENSLDMRTSIRDSRDENPSKVTNSSSTSSNNDTKGEAHNKFGTEKPSSSQSASNLNDTKKPNLISGGTDAIARSMVGTDVWLLKKRSNNCAIQGKNKKKKQKKSDTEDFPPLLSCQRRTESWLGDEVSAAVRRLRTDFFVCHLLPKKHMTDAEKGLATSFSTYVQSYKDLLSTSLEESESQTHQSGIADTRNGLLEFSQYRNFQFDTIRRAKYSTAMLIYYLRNPNASGLIPNCTTCRNEITKVRWHRVNKAFDERRRNSLSSSVSSTSVPMDREELCAECFSRTSRKLEFIPVRVSQLVS